MKAAILSPEEIEDLIQRGAKAALTSFLTSHPDFKKQPTKVQEQDSLLTTKELQEELKVSRVTINAWMRSGEIRFKRIGRRVYFSRAQVMEMNSAKGGRKHGQ
ncbi:MAG: helix-turn-helix domain-containing protein [Bacteroidetes bacterium]|nr:helix-turn-helix domain-containing protein [Bacteroidota bacterium]